MPTMTIDSSDARSGPEPLPDVPHHASTGDPRPAVSVRRPGDDGEWRQAIALVHDLAEWIRVASGIDLHAAQPGFTSELADLRAAYGEGRGHLFAAFEHGLAVGTAAVRFHPDGTGELKRMYVRRAARGHGAGDRLVEEVVAAAAAHGCTEVWLETLPGAMHAAISVYRRHGFVEAQREHDSGLDGTIVMVRDLHPSSAPTTAAPSTSAAGTSAAITLRRATRADLPELEALADAAIGELQRPFLDEAQIAASRAIMGIDSRLVDDGTYVVAELDGRIVGCGGWSRRRTMYGGDHTAERDDGLLDPAVDNARVRAMYTRPGWARRGIGRRILEWCQTAAAAEGFGHLELVATMAGTPLYLAAGFRIDDELTDTTSGVVVPLRLMSKPIGPA